jgi:hypothetical protein
MISLKFHGILTKEWWTQIRRKAFVRKEVKAGRIMVIWTDVDEMVYGWNMSADEELGLGAIAAMIGKVKRDKLIQIINGKENLNGTQGKQQR